MSGFLLKLLGVQIEGANKILGAKLAFYPGVNPVLVFFIFVIAVLYVIWIYRVPLSDIPRWKKNLMTILRIGFLLLLTIIILKPTLAINLESSIRRSLIILIDSSASMQIRDLRRDSMDLKRAAIAAGFLDPSRGIEASVDPKTTKYIESIPRIEIVRSVLTNENIKLLPRLEHDFDLDFMVFGKNAKSILPQTNSAVSVTNEQARTEIQKKAITKQIISLKPTEPQTAIGDSIRDVLSAKKGKALAGILIMTDGANNSGASPEDIAQICKEENVPLYLFGTGITSPTDLILVSLFAPEVAFAKEETTATVRIKTHGLKGKSGVVRLYLNNYSVDEKPFNISDDGEQTFTMKFTPQDKGIFELKAAVEPFSEESVKDNNSQSRQIRIIDQKINVLFVEQAPRWEYRYLLAKLMRDRRISLKTILFEADQDVVAINKELFLEKFPSTKDELFKFDIILFGDIDPKYFNQNQFDMISEFVARFGGGFIMIAGKKFSPWAYRKTTIEKLLPVEFETTGVDIVGNTYFEKPVKIELTPSGKLNPMLRFSDQDTENQRLWQSLPPIFWVAHVSRAKPAADVLIVDSDPSKENRFGKMPVLAIQQYGVGQTMFVGTDNTWRWRKNEGEKIHEMFWIQILQRMALPKLLGGTKKTQLSCDKQTYLPGEKISILARLYNQSYEPMTEPSIKGYYEPAEKNTLVENRGEVVLRLAQDQPGVYRGEFVAPYTGKYKFYVAHDPESYLDIVISEPNYEFGETAMNDELLKRMAAKSGGLFFREEDLYRAPDLIKSRAAKIISTVDVHLWSSPIWFILMISILTAEWILRKKSFLK